MRGFVSQFPSSQEPAKSLEKSISNAAAMTEAEEEVRGDDSNREAQQAAQALERVTDHVEERQLDENKVQKVRAFVQLWRRVGESFRLS